MLTRVRRISKLGQIGEMLAEEALNARGFTNVKNLNTLRHNQPYADLIAERGGKRFFIGVKTRNEDRDVGLRNESYNCVLVSDAANRRLKALGLSVDQITAMALKAVEKLATDFEATAAWIAIPARPEQGTYAVYFGLLSDLSGKRSIPMTESAIAKYECLVDWTSDSRIVADLTNRKRLLSPKTRT